MSKRTVYTCDWCKEDNINVKPTSWSAYMGNSCVGESSELCESCSWRVQDIVTKLRDEIKHSVSLGASNA